MKLALSNAKENSWTEYLKESDKLAKNAFEEHLKLHHKAMESVKKAHEHASGKF
jgi:hypothetical protein